MTQRKREREPVTAWQPMLVALLENYLPGGWKLLAELMLSRFPLRADVVILRLVEQVAGEVEKLHSIFDHLRPHTIIEHKGATDDLEAEDAHALLAYASQYMRLYQLSDPRELCLMVVCDHIPQRFVEQARRYRGRFAAQGGGLWRGEIAGIPLRGVETSVACQADSSAHLLYAFTHAFLKDPAGGPPLDEEERAVYASIYQRVEQFRRERGDMAVRDYEALRKVYDEQLQRCIERMPPEELEKLAAKAMPALTEMACTMCAMRLTRPLTEAERATVGERCQRLGALQVSNVFATRSADAVVAWLADPNAT